MSDPRAERSRQALRCAFNAMVVATPYDQIRVHAIVAAAGISRSTFYELFASKDALLQDVLVGPFSILADCIDDQADSAPVRALLQHFWDTSEQGRAFLDGALYRRTQAVLARLLLERIRRRRLRLLLPDELAATTLAALQLSILRSWLHHGRADQLATIAEAIGTASHQALRASPA